MPRKQYDILKDLFSAHQDNNQLKYSEFAKEYLRYLRWKKFHLLADDFEKIFFPNTKEETNHKTKEVENNEENSILYAKQKEQLTLFEPKFMKKKNIPQKKVKSKPAWQLSRGAEINFTLMQHLLDKLFESNNLIFTTDELMKILSYSKEKTQGFTRLLFYLGILEENTKAPTPLANLILKYDPYYEDVGTLWFLHYVMSSNPDLIIWNRVTNNLMQKNHFKFEEAESLFLDQKETHTEYSFKMHLRKEFIVCTRAYLESEFRKLNLLQSIAKDEYSRSAPTPIPDAVLFASISLFKEKFFPKSVALEVKSLYNAENSPGKLFYLKEFHFREALERLRKESYIIIESFADLDQIKFIKDRSYLECLENYYINKFGIKS